MNRWRIASALVANIVLFVLMPYFLALLGFMPELAPRTFFVLLVTTLGLILKVLLGDVASGRFDYHRHGYDFCIITLGASLSSLSLQIISDTDILPGLPPGGLFAIIASVAPQHIVVQRIVLLLIIFLGSCIAALFTAGNSREIREGTAKKPNVLSLINWALGTAVFGFYIYILIARG